MRLLKLLLLYCFLYFREEFKEREKVARKELEEEFIKRGKEQEALVSNCACRTDRQTYRDFGVMSDA